MCLYCFRERPIRGEYLRHLPTGHKPVKVVQKGKRSVIVCVNHQNKKVCDKIVSNSADTAMREITILRKLSLQNIRTPRNIVTFHSYAESCISYDYIPGCTLSTFTKKKLPNSQIQIIAKSLTELVSHCHKEKVWHLDIKPSNVICYMNKIDRLYLIDFGHAIIDNKLWKYPKGTGTPGYSSPEQIIFKEAYDTTDVWLIGCCLHACSFGYPAFPAKHDQHLTCLDNFQQYRQDYLTSLWKTRGDRFTSFMSNIFRLSPSKRPNIISLMQHPFIKQLLS